MLGGVLICSFYRCVDLSIFCSCRRSGRKRGCGYLFMVVGFVILIGVLGRWFFRRYSR